MNLGTLLTRAAQPCRNKPALIFEGRTSFSYGELNERSNRWSHALLNLGVGEGDRVGVCLMNSNEYLEVCFGLFKIGAAVVPLSWRLSPSELEGLSKNSGLQSLIFSAEVTKSIEAIRSQLNVKDYICVGDKVPAWAVHGDLIAQYPTSEPKLAVGGMELAAIWYTSGTSGQPKGVVSSHEKLFWWCISLLLSVDVRRNARTLLVLPLSQALGFVVALTNILRDSTIILMNRFEPMKVLERIRDDKVDTFFAVPTMLHLMAQVPDFQTYMGSIRILVSAGSTPSTQLIQTYLQHGLKIENLYGATECAVIGAFSDALFSEAPEKASSAGLSPVILETRVVDEDGVDVAPGQIGEMIVKGPSVFDEYWNNSEATKEAIKDGWYFTGDLVKLDVEGFIHLVDRKHDLIKSGGMRVYANEVEAILAAHPKIDEVAVIGVPDVVWGQSVCAVIRPKKDVAVSADEILEFCDGKLARFKIPKRVIIRDAPLPRNGAGKILKRAIRQELFP